MEIRGGGSSFLLRAGRRGEPRRGGGGLCQIFFLRKKNFSLGGECDVKVSLGI